jgi:hypothetical protein
MERYDDYCKYLVNKNEVQQKEIQERHQKQKQSLQKMEEKVTMTTVFVIAWVRVLSDQKCVNIFTLNKKGLKISKGSKEEGQTIQWPKEEGQTIQWPKEEGQTIQWPKEEGQTIQWPKEKRRYTKHSTEN